MTGLEVAGLVFAIIQAFEGAAALYQQLQERKRSKQFTNKRLEMTLRTSGPAIKNEYNNDLTRFGRSFALGDERAKLELQQQLILLQQAVISIMQRELSLGYGAHSNFSSLTTPSDNARFNSINALSQLYQRLSQAAPIPPSLAPYGSTNLLYSPLPTPYASPNSYTSPYTSYIPPYATWHSSSATEQPIFPLRNMQSSSSYTEPIGRVLGEIPETTNNFNNSTFERYEPYDSTFERYEPTFEPPTLSKPSESYTPYSDAVYPPYMSTIYTRPKKRSLLRRATSFLF